MPVSYTHLDVYKRQPSGTSDVTFEELMQDGAQDGGGQTAETQGDGGPDGEQTRGGDRSEKDKFESRIRAALDSQRKGCLLYTSRCV